MISLPRGYLSISQIEMYQRCPRQYEFRYVREMISPPGIALAFGKSAHAACQHTHETIATTAHPAATEQVQQIFADNFESHLVECKLETDDRPDEAKDCGTELVRLYNEQIAPRIWPAVDDDGSTWIEREVNIDVAGIPMKGIVDLVDADDVARPEVCDLKTASKAKSQSDVDGSLQLSFYSLATGIESVRIDSLVKTKKPKLDRVRSRRRPADYEWLENVVTSVARAISMGAFPPCSADNWLCSEKWCGYWQQCRGARR